MKLDEARIRRNAVHIQKVSAHSLVVFRREAAKRSAQFVNGRVNGIESQIATADERKQKKQEEN